MKYSKILDVNDPKGKTDKSYALSIFVPNDFVNKTLHPGDTYEMSTGLKFNIPKDKILLIVPINENVIKKGLFVASGIIRTALGKGELTVEIKNIGANHAYIRAGDEVAKIAIFDAKHIPLESIDEEDLFPPTKEADAETDHEKEYDRRVKILEKIGFTEGALSYEADGATVPKNDVRIFPKADFNRFVKEAKVVFKKKKDADEAPSKGGDSK